MNNSQRRVKIRIEIERPKRKSGVYVRVLHWGIHGATRQREKGMVVDLKVFHQYQLEEGPDIFDGLNFKRLIARTPISL